MKKSDQIIQAFLDLPEDQRDDLGHALGVLLGSFFLRRSLRRNGANKWQVTVATSVMTSLVIMNRRLDRISELLKEKA